MVITERSSERGKERERKSFPIKIIVCSSFSVFLFVLKCMLSIGYHLMSQVKSRIKYQSYHNNFNDFMYVSTAGQTNLPFLRSLRQRLLLLSLFSFVSHADPLVIEHTYRVHSISFFLLLSFTFIHDFHLYLSNSI